MSIKYFRKNIQKLPKFKTLFLFTGSIQVENYGCFTISFSQLEWERDYLETERELLLLPLKLLLLA